MSYVEDKDGGVFEKISYTWIIEHADYLFLVLPHRQSAVVESTSGEYTWEVAIYSSKREPENARYLHLYLNLTKGKAFDMKGILVVSNSGDYVICKGRGQNRFTLPGNICNYILNWVDVKPALINDYSLKVTAEIFIKIHRPQKKVDHHLILTPSSDSAGVRVPERMCEVFESSAFTDVVFQFKEATLKAHKYVLCTRSPVFAAMFRHEFTENQTGVVKIVDFDSNIFARFLRFVYSGEVDVPSVEVAMELIRAAEKYDFPNLKFVSAKYITANLNIGNVGYILLFADRFRADDLKRKALDYVFSQSESSSNTQRELFELIGKANPELLAELMIAAEANISKEKSAQQDE